jgi:excisionase family DNA binding protein
MPHRRTNITKQSDPSTAVASSEPDDIALKEAAARLHVDERTVRRWLRSGALKSYKTPGGQQVDIDPTRMYVRHPPTFQEFPDEICKLIEAITAHDDPHALYVSENDVYVAHVRLQMHKEEVERGNSISLLGAFLAAHQAGLYPPSWVLNRFATVFQKYYDQRGRDSLDRLLRLSVKPFRKRIVDDIHYLLAGNLFILTEGLGLSLEKAAEMIRIKNDCYPIVNHSVFKDLRTRYTAESLAQQYSRTWKKQFGFDRVGPDNIEHPNCPRRTFAFDWREYLKPFPPEALALLPVHLRKLYC